ncbi:hypothetical protein [Stieleria mannarensis]|uniref:hypothetical protein n=1 Tax=Stieleria mannarensis TaxID=2755585 RepID=UPI0015FFE4F2|nr:hypothetical protein [Rhodopirellula sp. JC639]
MKRIALAIAAMAAIAFGGSDAASAAHPAGYPFFPFGFYQPYGATYGSSLRTPPHFALNPPVYYGARHARPYGMSPFASPPLVTAGENYRNRLRTDFYLPPGEYQPAEPPACTANPCVSRGAAKPVKVGLVRTNPFVTDSQLVKN